MSPRLIDEKAEYPYKLKYDKAAGNDVIFYLKPLTHRESLKLTQSFRVDARLAAKGGPGAIVMDMADMKERVFISNVIRVEGIIWPGESDAITVESEEDKKKLFGMLCETDGAEILDALENMSMLTEVEIKN